MNIYKADGYYHLFSDWSAFSCYVLGRNVEEVIEICKGHYRDAQITSISLFLERILLSESLQLELG